MLVDADYRRHLLGAFIRAHRERVPPEGQSARRRTPGLRREELAARAGISPTWCTWLEQGRPVQASPETLARYTRSAPICVGDCYWLEALVHAIEASGNTRWADVRS